MQFLEGGANGSNGRDRAVRSTEQHPTGAQPEPSEDGPRGSLMSRYRAPGQPPAGPEDQAPPQPRTGEPQPPVQDSPWRTSADWGTTPTRAPEPRPDAPTARADAPTARPEFPGPRADAPTVRSDAPTARPEFPGARADAPTVRSDAPTARTDFPAAPPRTPDTRPGDPAARTDSPAGPTAPAAPTAPAGRTADRTPTADKPAEKVTTATAVDETTTAPAAPPAVTVTRGTTPGAAATRSGMLSTDQVGEFKGRWRELQADFVDDPQQAVRGAGDLAGDVLTALSTAIADEERVARGEAGDGSSGTEDLRVALRHYRTLVDRLLEL